MNVLLTADLHLTDNELEEYRWEIFDTLEKKAIENNVGIIGILGDAFDRKDRHTGKLVNKLVSSVLRLQSKTHAEIIFLAGNHDAPLKGVFFWDFLNRYDHVSYVTEPRVFVYPNKTIWLLPFSPNPTQQWGLLRLETADTIFMHQPIQGVLIDERRKLEKAPPLPPLPSVPIFSGDIHHQQIFEGVIYIGVPHPVHFNETWKNRILLIKNDDYAHPEEIWVTGTRRAILDINDSKELETLDYEKGDQVRIRYHLTGDSLTNWSVEEEKIRIWAEDKGIHLASVEAVITGEGVKATPEQAPELEIMSPEEVIRKFCSDEKLSKEVLEMGLQLVKESQ